MQEITDLRSFISEGSGSSPSGLRSILDSDLGVAKGKTDSQNRDIRDFAEVCPSCHKKGIRKGPVLRGGRVVQRWECTNPHCQLYNDYYYWPDLISKRKEGFRRKINEFLFGGGSQSSRARELGIERETFSNKFHPLAEDCLDCIDIQRKFQPRWGGTLVLDATISGGWAIHAGFDEETSDAPCYTAFEEENSTSWESFFKRVDATGYKVRFTVSDKGPLRCLIEALDRHYPNIPHALDWVHEMRQIRKILPDPRYQTVGQSSNGHSKEPALTEVERKLYHLVDTGLQYSSGESGFDMCWHKIETLEREVPARGRQVIEILRKDLHWLKAGLKAGNPLRSTSNLAESSFSRLDDLFLNRMKGLHASSVTDARNQVDLFMAAYRVKPMDRSEDLRKAGRTTLELAGTDAVPEDVWQFIRKQ